MMGLFILFVSCVVSILALVATYLAIVERDLLKAILYSAIQSTLFAFLYYILIAPDIVLVYIPVAIGLYPLLMVIVVKKSERFEKP